MTFTFEVWGEEWGGRPAARAAVGTFTTVHVPQGAETAEPWPSDWVSALTG
jgi:acyl-CoA thioester hydrolase